MAAADESGLDKPVACVVAKPGQEIGHDVLVAWCRAAFKRPRTVVELPKTATGKVRRAVRRELVADVLVAGRENRVPNL